MNHENSPSPVPSLSERFKQEEEEEEEEGYERGFSQAASIIGLSIGLTFATLIVLYLIISSRALGKREIQLQRPRVIKRSPLVVRSKYEIALATEAAAVLTIAGNECDGSTVGGTSSAQRWDGF